MKVAIDNHPLHSGHANRGIGEYTKHLLSSLSNLDSEDFKVEEYNRSNKYDIIHFPYFDLFNNTFPWKKQNKIVVTIHDVIPLLYPNKYPPGIKGKFKFFLQKNFLNHNADAVITDSETSKKDIVRLLGFNPVNVFPIYLAPTLNSKSKISLSETKKKFNINYNYVLYVGDVNYNKNLTNLAAACIQSKITLIVVGKKAATGLDKVENIEEEPFFEFLQKYKNNPLIKRVGYVDDDNLINLFKLASAYFQPSLYEGFGIGVVNAMKLECPVICSRTQTLVEITKNKLIYANPRDIEEMTVVIRQVTESPKIQANLIEEGKSIVKFYTWENTAEQTLSVYRKVYEKTKI